MKKHKKIYRKSLRLLNKKLFQLLFLSFLLFVTFSLSVFLYYAKDLPRPESFTERPFVEPTKIYDRTGETVLYAIYGEEKRDVVPLSLMPDHLIHAVISAEDSRFYSHFGVDFRGIARSFIQNIKKGSRAQGGSTISQQLIRSTFLSGEKTISRKIREVILAIELDRRYSKDEIIGFYLNQVPFGGNSYGVEAASQSFFNKNVSSLTVPESAILASLIKAPSRLSPYGPNKEDLIIRKNYVLDRMAYLGYISEEDLISFKEEEVFFSPTKELMKAPHFTLEIIDYLIQNYGEEYLKTSGLKVYTTIDWDLQKEAEKIIKERFEINKFFNSYNSSLVALDPDTGEILSMVGSVDYSKSSIPLGCVPGKNCLFEPYPNVSLRERQPGSAFKPFVYADAFKKGYTENTIVIDEPINIADYEPQNYDGLFRGPVTLREALAQSLNVPAVKVLHEFTSVKDSIKTATDFGITTLDKPASFYGLSLVLGGAEVTLLEMASAYAVFASKGFYVTPSYVLKITDSNGNIIEQKKSTPRKVIDSQITEMINSILSDNEARSPAFGEKSIINIDSVSVKTGTTQDFKDGWVIGYNPSIVVGVWSGNNDNTSMVNAPGVVVSGPIWRNLFDYYLSR
jgi:1A family penicillin-binding protein